MMNRPFTKRENAALLVFAILLVTLFYYRFVVLDVRDRIKAADTTELTVQLSQEAKRAAEIKRMQTEMEENKENQTGYISTYDNQKAELELLNSIFMPNALTYNYSFTKPVANEDAVRRVISITFTAANYQAASTILQELHDSPYRCLINHINMTAENDNSVQGMDPSLEYSMVNASLDVTFFETLVNATTTDGLDIQETTAAPTGIANADVSGIERNDLETAAESLAGETP